MTANSDIFRRYHDATPPLREHKRTQYVIRLTSGLYAGENGRWVQDIQDATRYDFKTSANVRAVMVMNFSVDEFTVEEV